MILVWSAVAFLSGSIPYSYWLGKYVLKLDIRDYGDGNPGATNVMRAAGKQWGILAGLLDALKGVVPVGLAYFVAGLNSWQLAVVALAPILGHAFSPWLGFRGGKAVAVTFGVWVGLTLWEAPIILGLALLFTFKLTDNSGWALVGAKAILITYLLVMQRNEWFVVIAVLGLVLLAWKYRGDLVQMPQLRSARG
ncbi:MAG: glycerol-3-phosphate acyltransferase [Anaerolineae bacterium]|nr:glycerol-3-phosphate acyltransferase [Anaerolineae bacterium]